MTVREDGDPEANTEVCGWLFLMGVVALRTSRFLSYLVILKVFLFLYKYYQQLSNHTYKAVKANQHDFFLALTECCFLLYARKPQTIRVTEL